MKKSEITRQEFNKFLDLLDRDREIAAEKYQSLYSRLVRIFLQRKAFPAEEFADKTIDIAIRKIDFLTDEYKGNLFNFFFKIAQNLILENSRKPKKEVLKEHLLQVDPRKTNESYAADCLRECLGNLSTEQQMLLVGYFRYSKITKINYRKKMADELNVEPNLLRTRVYRIKAEMEKCIRKCVQKKVGDVLAKKIIYK